MISQFSSLIEFLAAIYVSMSLDNKFCKRFWTPDFFNEIDKKIKNLQIDNHLVYDKINKSIKDKSDNIQNSSLKRGGFMLGFCVFLLIYIGLEDSQKTSDPFYNLPISSICLIVFLITSFLNKYVFRKWKYVVYMLIAIIICFFYLRVHLPMNIASNFGCSDVKIEIISWITNVVPYIEIGIFVLCILFPIFHQILTNWIYSRAYKEYLEQKINYEMKLYENSKQGINNYNKELVSKVYLDAFNDSYFLGKSDRDVTVLNEVLYKRLMKITVPSIVLLIWYHLKFQLSIFISNAKDKVKNFKTSKQELPTEASTDNDK